MSNKAKNLIITLSFVFLIGALSVTCLIKAPTAVSDSERRPLAQLPEFTADRLLNGKYFPSLESYTVDQFPLRDTFRAVKAFVQTKILGRTDNNGYYKVDDYVAKTDFPLNTGSVIHAIDRIQYIYDSYLKNGKHNVIYSIIPDKGYFLAQSNGYPSMDYLTLLRMMADGLSNRMTYTDIFVKLGIEDYYKTDTHWSQDCLEDVVKELAQALGIADKLSGEYTVKELAPFYGVYSGQSALPCDPESIRYLTNEILENCTVHNLETGESGKIYDLDRFDSQDPYEIFLSGSQAILTIENPANTSGERLVIFRDSFGSSLAPLLAEAYSEVILVDIRYVSSAFLDRFLKLTGEEDILFLYSTLVLNNSSAMK